MTPGYIIGNILGPLIAFGIMWYVGYRKKSSKLQWSGILCFLAYECSFFFGFFAMLIISAVGAAIFFTCNAYFKKKNENQITTAAATANTKNSISEQYAEIFYERIDYIWSRQGPTCYRNVKMREAALKDFLCKKHEQLMSLPEYRQNPKTFQSLALLQCFALSFVVALSLQDDFAEYSEHEVSIAMMEVMSEYYLSENEDFEVCVTLMIMESSNIVRLTLANLEEQ